jgi:type II secretion system protein H
MLSQYGYLPIFNRMGKELELHAGIGRGDLPENDAGITLMEIMIVLVVIGILAAAAAPNMIGWFSKRTLDTVTREMHANFQRARSEAITRGRTVQIQIDVANDWYAVQDADGNVIVPQRNMPQGIDIENSTFPLNPANVNTTGITFRGFATTAEGTVTIRSADAPASSNWRTIRLNPGGVVSIEP